MRKILDTTFGGMAQPPQALKFHNMGQGQRDRAPESPVGAKVAQRQAGLGWDEFLGTRSDNSIFNAGNPADKSPRLQIFANGSLLAKD